MKYAIINVKKNKFILKLFLLSILVITLLTIPLLLFVPDEIKIIVLCFNLFCVLFVSVFLIREIVIYSGKYREDSKCFYLRKGKKEYMVDKGKIIIMQISSDDSLHRFSGKDDEIFVRLRIKHHTNFIPIRIAEKELIKKLIVCCECRREPSDFCFDWEK